MVTPTNSLVLLLPPSLFSPTLLPMFEAHFATYGSMVLWTPLEKLGRVLVAYEEVDGATEARREMDGFVWEAEGEATDAKAATTLPESDVGLPLRAFFGPSLTLPLPSLHSTLLSVPELGRNFLISPPGSPPVGWEQVLEEAPNSQALPEDGGWADELARALRFLSTEGGGDDDDDDGVAAGQQEPTLTHANPSSYGAPQQSTTSLLIPPSATVSRTSITVSTPPTLSHPSSAAPGTDTPPPGAQKIGAVKATIESMLGRKRSYSDLGLGARTAAASAEAERPTEVPMEDDGPSLRIEEAPTTLGLGMPRTSITPTARPPLASQGYSET